MLLFLYATLPSLWVNVTPMILPNKRSGYCDCVFTLPFGFTCLEFTPRMLKQGCAAPFTCLGVFMLGVSFYSFTLFYSGVCSFDLYFLLSLNFIYLVLFHVSSMLYPFTLLLELLLQLLLFMIFCLFLRSHIFPLVSPFTLPSFRVILLNVA